MKYWVGSKVKLNSAVWSNSAFRFCIYSAVWLNIWPSSFLFIRPSGFGRMGKSAPNRLFEIFSKERLATLVEGVNSEFFKANFKKYYFLGTSIYICVFFLGELSTAKILPKSSNIQNSKRFRVV